jgi:hypothetical protein
MIEMEYIQKCSKCGASMKRIPIRRLDSSIIFEFYCDRCDESITYYPDVEEFEIRKPEIL